MKGQQILQERNLGLFYSGFKKTGSKFATEAASLLRHLKCLISVDLNLQAGVYEVRADFEGNPQYTG